MCKTYSLQMTFKLIFLKLVLISQVCHQVLNVSNLQDSNSFNYMESLFTFLRLPCWKFHNIWTLEMFSDEKCSGVLRQSPKQECRYSWNNSITSYCNTTMAMFLLITIRFCTIYQNKLHEKSLRNCN